MDENQNSGQYNDQQSSQDSQNSGQYNGQQSGQYNSQQSGQYNGQQSGQYNGQQDSQGSQNSGQYNSQYNNQQGGGQYNSQYNNQQNSGQYNSQYNYQQNNGQYNSQYSGQYNNNPYYNNGGMTPVNNNEIQNDKKGLGIAALILGILGILCCCTFCSLPIAIIGLILSIVCVVKGTGSGKTLGIIALILNSLSLILAFVAIYFVIIQINWDLVQNGYLDTLKNIDPNDEEAVRRWVDGLLKSSY